MNRTARTVKNLVLATGFSAAALTLTVTPAHADGPQGPGGISQAPIVDPTPDPEPQPQLPTDDVENPAPEPNPHPKPQPNGDGPGEITDTPDCTHGCGGGGEVPDDKQGPNQEPGDEPTDNPAEDAPLDQGCFTGCDLPEEDPEVTSVSIPSEDVQTPTRIDAGLGDEAASGQGGSDSTWLLAGGALTALAGAAAAARARSRRNA